MKLKKYGALICVIVVSVILVACSGSGTTQVLTPTSTSNSSVKILTASVGVTANLQSIAKGNGVYIAVGDSGVVLTSTDGKAWYSVSMGLSIDMHAITYNSSTRLFYAVGSDGVIMSSSNGTSWTQYKTLKPVKDLYSVISVNGDLVIGASDSTIFEIDTNGRQSVSARATVGNMKLISAAYGNGVMVLGSDDGSILYKSASNMGANWNRATKFVGTSINSLSYESTDKWFLAGTSTGEVTQAESNMIWSTPVTASGSSINSIILDSKSNDFIAIGGTTNKSTMVTSDDYNAWNQQTLPVSNVQLNDIKCFDNNDCFIVGNNGTILSGTQRDISSKLPIWTAVGVDIVAPTVIDISPADKATNVSNFPTVQISFSEPVNNLFYNISLHIGSPTGESVAIRQENSNFGSYSYSTFSPVNKLKDLTTYYVVIGNGVTDLSGNALLATSFSFTTADITAPTAVMTSPVSQSIGYSSTTPNIQVSFSEHVVGVESNIRLCKTQLCDSNIIAIGNITQSSNNTYTFAPSAALSEQEYYYVVLGGGITDDSGNALKSTYFMFQTGDFTAPTVTMTMPTSGTTNIVTNPVIKLLFSEGVSNLSGNITLHENSPTGSVIPLDTMHGNSYSGVLMVSIPQSSLKYQTTYYVVAESAITDAYGNHLAKSQFSFTTMPDVPLAKSISVGGDTGCYIASSGKAYCWGTNNYGQLGNGTTTNSNSPVAVTLPSGVTSFTSISAGGTVTCGIGNNNKLYCWGSNSSGQLGNGTVANSNNYSTVPVAVTLPSASGLTSFTSVSAAFNSVCAMGNNGLSFCWGDNQYGQLGNDTKVNSNIPVFNSTSLISIIAGSNNTCGIDKIGQLYCWGDNQYGQLGNGTKVNSTKPVAVTNPDTGSFISFDTGGVSSCGITQYNNNYATYVYCWGDNRFGQLGGETTGGFSTTPQGVSSYTISPFKSISSGGATNCGISSDGSAYCWGAGSSGQIGDGVLRSTSNVPSQVVMPNSATSFLSISTSGNSTCALANDGNAYCWGGIAGNSKVPVMVK